MFLVLSMFTLNILSEKENSLKYETAFVLHVLAWCVQCTAKSKKCFCSRISREKCQVNCVTLCFTASLMTFSFDGNWKLLSLKEAFMVWKTFGKLKLMRPISVLRLFCFYYQKRCISSLSKMKYFLLR